MCNSTEGEMPHGAEVTSDLIHSTILTSLGPLASATENSGQKGKGK